MSTKIYAPSSAYSGTYTWGDGTVTEFHDGVAEVDDLSPAVRGYLASNGYGIGKPAPTPADDPVVPPDPRDGLTDQVGSRLRDAAVDPHEDDFLPPINAGKEGPEGNPHGPNVVSPEIHGSVGQAIAPGPVPADAGEQQAKESELAERTRIEGEPVPQVVQDMGEVPAATHTPDPDEPKGNASRDDWAAYAKSQGATDDQLANMSRDDIRGRYGS